VKFHKLLKPYLYLYLYILPATFFMDHCVNISTIRHWPCMLVVVNVMPIRHNSLMHAARPVPHSRTSFLIHVPQHCLEWRNMANIQKQIRATMCYRYNKQEHRRAGDYIPSVDYMRMKVGDSVCKGIWVIHWRWNRPITATGCDLHPTQKNEIQTAKHKSW